MTETFNALSEECFSHTMNELFMVLHLEPASNWIQSLIAHRHHVFPGAQMTPRQLDQEVLSNAISGTRFVFYKINS